MTSFVAGIVGTVFLISYGIISVIPLHKKRKH